MKNTRRAIALLLVLMILVHITVPVSAASTMPRDVKTRAEQLMRKNGTSIAFVVKTDGSGKGTAYMTRRTRSGKVVCDRSGTVIIGKNTPIMKAYEYEFYRNRKAERRVWNWTEGKRKLRERYTSFIVCKKGGAFDAIVHSYVEYKDPGRPWKICKGKSKNTDGIAMCERFARYLWSCADDHCPVAFM